MIPQRREDGLLIEELADETVVYDKSRHKVHCLNRTAAQVWKHCDGRTSVTELGHLLRKDLNVGSAEEVVGLALDQLTKARLLIERLPPSADAPRYSRREVARKFALAAKVVLLPAVITMAVPTAAVAGSSCIPQGGNCLTTSECCPAPGICCRIVAGLPACKPGAGACI